MAEVIFREWLIKIDKLFERQKKKILLFLDYFSGHYVNLNLKNVKLAYFPPNCTSKLQPLDQGIIALFKKSYRAGMVRKLIEQIDAEVHYEDIPEMNVMSAID